MGIEDNNRGARDLIKMVEYLRDIDATMSMHQLNALMIVAEAGGDGITMRDVETRMGVSNATLSRNISYWSKWKRHELPGMDFIQTVDDPTDRRYKIAKLTPKGQAFFEKVVNFLR